MEQLKFAEQKAETKLKEFYPKLIHIYRPLHTRDVFYVLRKADLMKTAKVNAYIMHIFGE